MFRSLTLGLFVLMLALPLFACAPDEKEAPPEANSTPIMPSVEGQPEEMVRAPQEEPREAMPTERQAGAGQARGPAGVGAKKNTAPDGPAPDIHVAEPVFDWGVATPGDKVTHVFEVQNVGDTVLTLDRADAG